MQELCTGGSLHEHLSTKGTCSEPEAATIMQGVLDLLVECHRRHICYGDLKPANIMFSDSLQVKAIDFGCSRSVRGRALTQTCGSPVYAAPEIAQQRYGVNVDVWSAGVLVSAQVGSAWWSPAGFCFVFVCCVHAACLVFVCLCPRGTIGFGCLASHFCLLLYVCSVLTSASPATLYACQSCSCTRC